MKINRVILAGLFSFPFGDAAGSRIKNLALGFKDHVDDVSVISTFYDNNTKIHKEEGVESIMGVDISFLSILPLSDINATSNVKDRIFNRVTLLRLNGLLADKIVNNLHGDETELLFLYGRSYLFLNDVLKQIARKGYKTKVVFDIVEPPRIQDSKLEYLFHPFVIDSTLAFRRLLHRFDLCTYISYKLYEVYGKNVKNKIIVPSVIYLKGELSFHILKGTHIRLGYLGSLFEKDYPELMYRLCLELWERKVDFSFSIIGRYRNFLEGRKWEKHFKESPFQQNVHFYFNPNEDEKWEMIKPLDFMVCFRAPLKLQEYTFPTRVPELLVLGKVLIVNNFGDFSKYFENGINAIVVDEKNLEHSVECFQQYLIPKNYEAMCVQAKHLISTQFSARVASQRILEIFNK